MIGFYNYTVWVTYLSIVFAFIGITMALEGNATEAVACLMLSGFCDCIDGKVARTKKNRTENEKRFGIQIDSLCDVICFGLFPAIMCYELGVDGLIGMAFLIFYCCCGVIRLAYFNVLEEENFGKNIEKKYYHGMPITFMSAIFPLVYMTRLWFTYDMFTAVLHFMLLITGLLFIIDFPFPRTRNSVGISLMLIDIVALGLCFWNNI